MNNVLSVDLEDWYHICGIEESSLQDSWKKYATRLERNTDKILHLLGKHNVQATFFTVGIIAENDPALIKKIANAGHELATHGFAHRRIFDMSPEEFEADLLRSKLAIEKASGKKVLGYRAPEWSLKKSNLWALDILKKHGFVYDASAVPLSHLGGKNFRFYPYEIITKYGNIIEFPLSTFRCFWERLPFSGGLPMRINPYFHILDSTRMINRMGYPVIFYLHPWEFDAERTKVDLPINRKFMHYCNLSSTEKKIKLLLERVEFSSIEEVLKLRKANCHEVESFCKCSKYYDSGYFKSIFLTSILVISLFLIIVTLSYFIKLFSVLLIIVMLTIFYWPLGWLFKTIDTLFSRKQKRFVL